MGALQKLPLGKVAVPETPQARYPRPNPTIRQFVPCCKANRPRLDATLGRGDDGMPSAAIKSSRSQ